MGMRSRRCHRDGPFCSALMGKPQFNVIERKFTHGSFSPFDGDDGVSIEIFLQAKMRHRLGRFKPVEIGMRQRKPPTIFMDQDKGWATDAAR